MSSLEKLIKKSLCWSLSEKANDLTVDFLGEFGINYFDYTRFYKNGSFFPIFTDKNYLSFILNQGKAKYHQEYIPPTSFLNAGKYNWSSYIEPDFLLQAENKFQHYHGITLIKHGDDYDELINFSAPFNNFNVIEIYESETLILDYFINIFIKEFDQLMQRQSYHCCLPKKYESKKHKPSDDLINHYLKKIYQHNRVRKNQVLIPLGRELIAISRTEFECLKRIIDGLTNKEIAKQFSVSPRTIDTLVERIMRKTNIKQRAILISAFPKSLLEKLTKIIEFF